jgi:hypothetical protein
VQQTKLILFSTRVGFNIIYMSRFTHISPAAVKQWNVPFFRIVIGFLYLKIVCISKRWLAIKWLIVLMMPTFIVSLCFPKSYLQSEKKL